MSDLVNEEEQLINFCKLQLARIDMGKKFKKTDKADLLKLLIPNIPETTLKSYKKNNTTWKEGSLLRCFDELVFTMFLSGLRIHTDRLDPNDDPAFVDKFDYRYMDTMVRVHVEELKEAQQEVEELRQTSITEKEYYNIVNEKEEYERTSEKRIAELEQKLETQRKYFEDRQESKGIQHEKQLKFYKDALIKESTKDE
tara:strand:+ start:17 stop:610 length:594 start_codon:yes stop_codon:yes gene_type:complete